MILIQADNTSMDQRKTNEISELRQLGIQMPPEADLLLNNDQNGWTEMNKRRKTHRGKDKAVRDTRKGIAGQMKAVRRTLGWLVVCLSCPRSGVNYL